MKDINLIAIIVIYNVPYYETAPYLFFTAANENLPVEIRIVDNSDQEDIRKKNEEYLCPVCVKYLSMGGNKGLPKAYNQGISTVENLNAGYFILSDQDTEYPADYLEKVKKIITGNELYLLYAPWVEDRVGVLSPAIRKGVWIKRLSKDNKVNKYNKRLTPINSGLIVSGRVFQKVRYDDRLFLDFCDHDFAQSVQKAFPEDQHWLFIMKDVRLYQHFSGSERSEKASAEMRFQIYMHDGIYYYDKWYRKHALRTFPLFIHAISLTIRYNDLFFIKEMQRSLKACR